MPGEDDEELSEEEQAAIQAAYTELDELADTLHRMYGEVLIHSTVDDEWCIHLGGEEQRGCRRIQLIEAVLHGYEHLRADVTIEEATAHIDTDGV